MSDALRAEMPSLLVNAVTKRMKEHTKRRNAEPSLSQLGLSKKEYGLLKSKNTREILSNMVEEASQLASKDWAGSGSSEQVGILIDFFKALEEPVVSGSEWDDKPMRMQVAKRS